MSDGESGAEAEAAAAARSESAEDADSGSYSLVWRSLKVAWASDSYLLRSYAVVGGLVAAFLAALVVLALPRWITLTLGGGGTATFSRAFLILSGLLVVVPTLAPAVFARSLTRAGTATRRRHFLLALSGYAFVASLYLGLVVSQPLDQRELVPAGVPRIAGAALPVLGAVLVFGLGIALRKR